MCIGLPMQVIQADGIFAWCEAGAERERLDMRLVGDQPVGTWVLGFHGGANIWVNDFNKRLVGC